MDALSVRPTGRTWPTGLLGMLGMVALIELTIHGFDDRFQTPGFTGFRFTSRAIPTEAPRTEVLVIGDSLLKFGLVPRILEERLGARAYNLAHIGGQPPDTYVVLRQALERGARPRAIVVNFKASAIQTTPHLMAAERTELYRLADCVEIVRQFKNVSYSSKLLMSKVLPSFKYRASIRGEVRAAIEQHAWAGHGDLPTIRRNWEVNLGANVSPRVPGVKDIPEYWDEKAYLIPTFHVDPINHHFIKRTLELAARHQIPVYWVIPPINPRVQIKREAMGLDWAFADYVTKVQAKSPNVIVVDGRRAGYDAEVFVDGAHLDRVGASAFTTALAEVLRRGHGGPRWVELPHFRAPGNLPARALEDLDQSRVAVTTGGTSERVLR